MTTKTFSTARSALFAAAALAASTLCSAQTYSQWGSVARLEAGWSADTISLYHSAPLVNPSGCSVTAAGYATDPADPGRALFHTLLLSAFLNRKEVQVLVLGCVFNKPKIIAVGVR